jgi:hypothetical protein
MNLRSCIPYLILATICCASSVGIVMIALLALTGGGQGGTISDHGMFAIAGMALAPAAIGVGIAPHIPGSRD